MGIIVLGMSETLGTRLKRIREKTGITQENLAHDAKVSSSTITRLERGATNDTKTQELLRIADALRVSPCELLGRDCSHPETREPYDSLKEFLGRYAKRMHINDDERQWLQKPLPNDRDVGTDDFWMGLLVLYRQAKRAVGPDSPTTNEARP